MSKHDMSERASKLQAQREEEQAILQQDGQQLEDLQRQMEEMKVNKQNEQPGQEQKAIELDGKATSIQMIVGFKEYKKGQANIDAVMKKMTHISLEGKGIELIKNLEKCPGLTHIYLQENQIYTLVNDPFQGLKNLTQLSLYENRIDRMEGLLDLVNLRKLYLERNLISKLEGLEACRKLEELYLGN